MATVNANVKKKNSNQMGIIVDVINHPVVSRWMTETAKQDIGFCRLVEPNNQRFKKLFGKPNWNHTGNEGWSEGWAVSDNGLNLMLLTGNEGTKFKVVLSISEEEFKNNAKMGLGINSYLQNLMQILMGK